MSNDSPSVRLSVDMSHISGNSLPSYISSVPFIHDASLTSADMRHVRNGGKKKKSHLSPSPRLPLQEEICCCSFCATPLCRYKDGEPHVVQRLIQTLILFRSCSGFVLRNDSTLDRMTFDPVASQTTETHFGSKQMS